MEGGRASLSQHTRGLSYHLADVDRICKEISSTIICNLVISILLITHKVARENVLVSQLRPVMVSNVYEETLP